MHSSSPRIKLVNNFLEDVRYYNQNQKTGHHEIDVSDSNNLVDLGFIFVPKVSDHSVESDLRSPVESRYNLLVLFSLEYKFLESLISVVFFL